ncbi:ubiquitin-like protein [Aureispira anguillae]|uniref:Ubiquitin-like domain-containing protein n=1 Tax=Aureispira anguillae TaxID=2864201 RepID=A0A916DV56_9BACT|nr:ubiquitin-like protein [Aureispira anguillae]BDS14016.1 hypothetical protein AsAng_0047790 [Aureispira anguillae]
MDELENITAITSLDTLVKSSEKPFQIFVKTLNGSTLVIDNMISSTKILTIMNIIQDKDGLPVEIQRLTYSNKNLDSRKTLADYKIGKEATLTSLLRLKGGMGEYKAMVYIDQKDMNRGNVKQEIEDTEGESRALKDWGRNLEENDAFWDKIKNDLKLDTQQFKVWKQKNSTHVAALIREITHSGNCGDFAEVVHSKLTRSTDNQYVYMLVMQNPLPDGKQDSNSEWMTNTTDEEKKAWFLAGSKKRKQINQQRLSDSKQAIKPKEFDHQMCLTYHEYKSEISEMDHERAMIADGWDGNMVCTLKQFLAGTNAYKMSIDKKRFNMDYPNIAIFNGTKAVKGSGPDESDVDIVNKIITAELDDYKTNGTYQNDKDTAKVNFSGIFNMSPRQGVTDKRTSETIKVFLDKIDFENDAERFKAECLDLSPEQFAAYCKTADSDRKKVILADKELKAGLVKTFEVDHKMLETFCKEFTDDEFVEMIIASEKIAKTVISTDAIANVFAKTLGKITDGQSMVDVIKATKKAESSYFDDFIEENIEESGDGTAIWVNIIKLLKSKGENALADYVLSKIPSSEKSDVEQELD